MCKATLKAVGGSTKSLHTHLRSKHYINLLKREDAGDDKKGDDSESQTCSISVLKPASITKYLIAPIQDKSLAATVARMTACDGLPYRVFTSSTDLRRILTSAGYGDVPKSNATIHDMVMKHTEKVRSFVIAEMQAKKNEGRKFSLTFDEWTSVRNRRYMVINVHEEGPQFWSLGLVRVFGSMPAEKCVELLEAKLKLFGLDLKTDIVGICTDGASVMVKVGKLIAAEHQLCYAHGVHLAVQDVLYKRRDVNVISPTDMPDLPETEVSEEGEGNEGESQDDDVDNDEADGAVFGVDVDLDEVDFDLVPELSGEYQEIVANVRKVVKLFRKSPTKNDAVLQKYVTEEIGKDLGLQLDCKTRWNSLLDMLKRFASLRGPIQKALIDLKNPITISDADFCVVDELVATLEPVALAVTVLSRRDINLLSAEAALVFCVQTLSKQQSELPKVMAEAIKRRISERYTAHSLILHYLHNGRNGSSEFGSTVLSPDIKKFVQNLVVRLDKVFDDKVVVPAKEPTPSTSKATAQSAPFGAQDESIESDSDPAVTLTLQQQMEKAIQESMSQQMILGASASGKTSIERSIAASIKTEMAMFKASGVRGHCLELVYRCLLTIPAASVEAERSFSAAGILCTKLRSRLSDKSLDSLCFLRSFYRERE